MSKRKIKTGFAALGVALGFPGALLAQQEGANPAEERPTAATEALMGTNVILRVNGMVCPMCAYGLEQRLTRIPAVDAVLVRVSDGLVYIRTKENVKLSDEMITDEVKKAGFVLTDIERVGA